MPARINVRKHFQGTIDKNREMQNRFERCRCPIKRNPINDVEIALAIADPGIAVDLDAGKRVALRQCGQR